MIHKMECKTEFSQFQINLSRVMRTSSGSASGQNLPCTSNTKQELNSITLDNMIPKNDK